MFWLTTQPTQAQRALFGAVLRAHEASAGRPNASTVAVANAAGGSLDYTKAIAAGLATLGGLHAPLVQTYDLIHGMLMDTTKRPPPGLVPGWGSSFHKGEPDPLWVEVDAMLAKGWPYLMAIAGVISRELSARGKNLYMNPSAYTAMAAIALECPRDLAPYLFVAGRLEQWSRIFQSTHDASMRHHRAVS